MKFYVGAVLAMGLVLGIGGAAGAQEASVVAPSPEDVGDPSDTYGVSNTSYVIGAYAFETYHSTNAFSGSAFGNRYLTNGGPFFAPVNLPNGAVITRLELQGCDTNANAGIDLLATLYSKTTTGGVESDTLHGQVLTGGAPGCGLFSVTFANPLTVTNQTRTYYISVATFAGDSTTRFSAVRLFYHLQVSPAPATATFPNDVPTTSPYFRFVEALAASGVSGGCGTGRFCPNDPLTRGQMAVFLATALGLNFPN